VITDEEIKELEGIWTPASAAVLGVKLVERLRSAEDALRGAIYDLERIRDADWTAEQMRMGAKSGAHMARAYFKSVEGK